MIKLPVKNPVTIPWMSRREIPAIKAALSAWRKMRKDESYGLEADRQFINAMPPEGLPTHAYVAMNDIGHRLEELAAIDERMRKEANNG
jgi:hypothetical protein